jgi:hypothetical protein
VWKPIGPWVRVARGRYNAQVDVAEVLDALVYVIAAKSTGGHGKNVGAPHRDVTPSKSGAIAVSGPTRLKQRRFSNVPADWF